MVEPKHICGKKHTFLEQIVSHFSKTQVFTMNYEPAATVMWWLAGLAGLLSGWLAGLLGWLLPGVTQSTPPQDWLKNAQIRQFVN